jgi:hypothetical protein
MHTAVLEYGGIGCNYWLSESELIAYIRFLVQGMGPLLCTRPLVMLGWDPFPDAQCSLPPPVKAIIVRATVGAAVPRPDEG